MNDRDAHFTQKDRDLMIEMNTTLKRAVSDIQNLSNNFASRDEVIDHEKRVRSLENFRDTLNGKIGIISFVISSAVGIISLIVGHYLKIY